jgi:hypothetical protein
MVKDQLPGLVFVIVSVVESVHGTRKNRGIYVGIDIGGHLLILSS